jgi:N-succinyldiaminopimelate aminotransferase
MNSGLTNLQPYPFEKLAALKQGITPPEDRTEIDLSIGEPKHRTPDFILDALKTHIHRAAEYPKTRGNDELREAISSWLIKRFKLPDMSIHPDKHVLPVNGTREALFSFAQCIIDQEKARPIVVIPNPFYQIYEGAALLAGARPYYINCVETSNFIPDFTTVPNNVWRDCQLIYICSPGNPTGAVINRAAIKQLLTLADKFDFTIAADECYSEIYFDEINPPQGLLQTAADLGRDDYRRCIVFHSLSKRSNVPGMRSGFVAGDETLIQAFLRYRTYHGCAMPGYTQVASTLAWQDEKHVIQNRKIYREKFTAVLDILRPLMKVTFPEAAFYLWPETSISDTEFTRRLFGKSNVTVLPGSFLSRTTDDINPGNYRLRIALVASKDECIEAANRICEFINSI